MTDEIDIEADKRFISSYVWLEADYDLIKTFRQLIEDRITDLEYRKREE